MYRFLLPALLLGGCTWVSQSDVDRRLGQLDDDGDGYARDEGDCDDADPAINPGAEDVWYDGVDSDCAGNDDYDQDGDGVQDPSGGGDDCDDLDAGVFPGAADDWYDGVDSDCAGNDDYDQDGDGAQDPSGGGDDCDDLDPDIYPGAADDWYDGVDSDCAGNDDYDQDGDGVRAAAGGGDDCDDTDAAIYPGASDTWYDGIDSDCLGDDDYDQDLDGIRHASAGEELVDCDDEDDSAYPGALEDLSDAVDHDCDGGADSFASDTLDWALDGANNLRFVSDADSLYLSFVSLEADDGSSVWNDQALAFVLPQSDPYADPELLTWFSSTPNDRGYIFATGQSLLIDGSTLFGAVGYLVLGETSSNRYLQIAAYDETWASTRDLVPYPYPGGMDADFDDIAFGMDGDGGLHAFGCTGTEADNLQYMRTTEDDLISGLVLASFYYEGTRFGPCSVFFDRSGPGGTPQGRLGFVDLDTGEYVSWIFDPAQIPPTSLSTPSDYFTEVSRVGGYALSDLEYPRVDTFTELLVDDASASVIVARSGQSQSIPGTAPVNADLLIDGDVWYVAWSETDGSVHLSWGDLLSGFGQRASMSLDFAAEEVALQLTDDGTTLLLGALSGEQIAIGAVPRP